MLSDSWHDIEGAILPTKVDKDLYKGHIHFLTAYADADMLGRDLIYDLLDIDLSRTDGSSYSRLYGGNWMLKVHEYFREYLRAERIKDKKWATSNYSKSTAIALLPSKGNRWQSRNPCRRWSKAHGSIPGGSLSRNRICHREDAWGRIDSLGIDENNCPVIIEYKRALNENVINQGLYYLDWLLDHKAEFTLLVQKKCDAQTAEQVDWPGARLLCIAGEFTKFDEHAVKQINRNIELISLPAYGNELLLLELVKMLRVVKLRIAAEKNRKPM